VIFGSRRKRVAGARWPGRNGNSWLISDIYLDGAISEVATRHSEFAAILKSQGIDGLIAALNRKADILTATTAKAS
jgi:ABC-type transporter MlaC component